MKARRKQLLMDFFLLLFGYMVGLRIFRRDFNTNDSFASRLCGGHWERQVHETERKTQMTSVVDNTLMIGVMTTRRHLATRATAIYATWGREVPGLVIFYIGQEDSSLNPNEDFQSSLNKNTGSAHYNQQGKFPQ